MLLYPSTSNHALHPFLESMAVRIRQHRSRWPGLTVLDLPDNLRDITGTLEGEAVSIRNELHYGKGLRKVHLEIARIGAGLQILHCVFFPDPTFDLPIFGTDVVVGPAILIKKDALNTWAN